MKRKYSKKLLWAAIDFMKAANEELGNIGDQQAYAMMDAFDPGLKRQLLLELMLGHNGGTIRIRKDPTVSKTNNIAAIKAVRSVCRFGLRESKDVIDAAENGVTEIAGNWTIDEYNALAYNLIGTGFELL